MFSELLKDPKNLVNAGAVIIALALVWLIATKWDSNDEAMRLNASAIAENTAVTKQFQSLLLDISKNTTAKKNILNALTPTNNNN